MIVNERISDYINSLDRELPDYLKKIEKQALQEYIPIIKKPTQKLLKFLISLKNPQNILEVGAAVGFSSLLMSEYIAENSKITTIEKMPKRIKAAKKNICSSGKEKKIQLLEGDAEIILKALSAENKEKYDFMFMDAAKGQYINFLPDIMKLLSAEGILISDNVLQDGDVAESRYAITRRNRTIHSRMREYLYTITHMEELETVILPIGDGVTLSTKLREN